MTAQDKADAVLAAFRHEEICPACQTYQPTRDFVRWWLGILHDEHGGTLMPPVCRDCFRVRGGWSEPSSDSNCE